MRCVSFSLVVLLLLAVYGPAHADGAARRKVSCVYPGEVLQHALNDLATQLGYKFQPGEMKDSPELEQTIWVHASDVSPQLAAELIGASGGVRVKLDDANRQVVVSELDEDTAVPGAIRSFQLDKLCALYRGYQKRYGEKSDAKADTDLGYRPTAAEELRDAVAEILQLEDDHPGSAVGKRLVYTLPADDLARIEELLGLLEAAGGGESNALTLDRGNRARLAKLHSNFGGEGTLVSAMLWQIFKDCDVPVYIDRGQMDGFDLEYDTTEVTLDGAHSHYDGLKALASEQDFFIDSKHGALRLHEDFFEGASSYRVFDVADLLAALEKDYAELKTDDDLAEGFHGDLRTQGGVQVVVDALTTQLDNAGFTPLIRAYGPRVVVVGGVDVVDRAAEVLKAIGWQPPSDKGETK